MIDLLLDGDLTNLLKSKKLENYVTLFSQQNFVLESSLHNVPMQRVNVYYVFALIVDL